MLFRDSIIVYIAVVIGTCNAASQGQCKATEWYKPKPCTEKALPKGDAFKVFSTDHKLKCMKACKNTTGGNCRSVSYDRRNQLCHHFDDIGYSCADMVEEPDTQYYHKDIECLNGGTRMSPTQCKCLVGFTGRNCNILFSGCQELYDSGVRGVNKVLIQPTPDGPPIPLYCNGRSHIIMYHYITYPFSFNRTWDEYVNGFMEHRDSVWIGLEALHQIYKNTPPLFLAIEGFIETGPQSRRILSVTYADFSVGNRSTNYTITYSSYKTPNEYGLGDILNGLNGSSFSTYDRDNDGDETRNCALQYAGGWWFNGLNGCSIGSLTSFVTCPTQDCGPMEVMEFPVYKHYKIRGAQLYLQQ